MAQAQGGKALRILLVGKTGVGKSATGNTILGRRDAFHSSVSCSSVTGACERQEAIWEGRRIIVVDTPGFFDTNNKKAFSWGEVKNCIGLLHPGPHAILAVIRAGILANEEKASIRQVKKLFSVEGKHFLILLFTHKDQLDKEGKALEDLLEKAPGDLRELMHMAENRHLAINNLAEGEEQSEQVAELINMIDDLVRENGSRKSCYTEELFRKDSSWCCVLL